MNVIIGCSAGWIVPDTGQGRVNATYELIEECVGGDRSEFDRAAVLR